MCMMTSTCNCGLFDVMLNLVVFGKREGTRIILVEHCTSIPEVMGSNPVKAAIIIVQLSIRDNCLNCPVKYEDYFSHSSTTRTSNVHN